MAELDIKKELALMLEDIGYFSKLILSHHIEGEVPQFHKDLYHAADSTAPRVSIVVPRGFGKSTTMTLVRTLHRTLFQLENFVVIVSDSNQQAKLFLEAIGDELKYNERLRYFFGDLTTDQWSNESLTTTTGIRLVARGSGQKLRGLKYHQYRPSLMLFDDIENDESVGTPEQRHKLKRWFYGAALPALAKNGRAIVVGTILHEDSLLNNIHERDDSFESRKFVAMPAPDASLWPEHHSVESLLATKKALMAQGLNEQWSQEYMCEAINAETAEFRPSEFTYYDASTARHTPRALVSINNVSHPLNVTIAVDPSLGKGKSDYSAIVVLGAAPDNHVYILNVIRRRLQPDALIDALFEQVLKWQPLRVAIETNGFQYLLAREMYEQQRRRNVHFRVEEYKSTTNKEARIRSLVPPVRSGTLVFPERAHPAGDSNDMIDELSMFPRARHDDASDALEAAMSHATKPSRRRGGRAPRHEYQPASKYGGY